MSERRLHAGEGAACLNSTRVWLSPISALTLVAPQSRMAGPGSTLPLVGKGGMVLPRKLLVVPRKDGRGGGEGTEAPGPSSDPCRRETHLSQEGKQTLGPGIGFYAGL